MASGSLPSTLDLILTLKVVFLIPLASLKHVGDLQGLSVSWPCIEFAPGLGKCFSVAQAWLSP